MHPPYGFGRPLRVIGFVGWSGAGKTTLLARLIPVLVRQGLRVSTIKHAHHGFDMDKPGKDSWVHREAGASEVLVGSATRWALLHELRGEAEPDLPALLSRLSPVDLVLVEGFKRGPHPRIEVHRAALGKDLLYPGEPGIVGIAAAPVLRAPIPCVPLNDIEAVARLALDQSFAASSMS